MFTFTVCENVPTYMHTYTRMCVLVGQIASILPKLSSFLQVLRLLILVCRLLLTMSFWLEKMESKKRKGNGHLLLSIVGCLL